VRGFLREGGGAAATAKVARLVDAYLAEAALEAGLRPPEFEELARAVPAHGRAAADVVPRRRHLPQGAYSDHLLSLWWCINITTWLNQNEIICRSCFCQNESI
jgi:hypothetical protein